MLLPQHTEWVEKLIAECHNNPDETQWWVIGSQMHTIVGDYNHLYPEVDAKHELNAMWEEWLKADPREKHATD